MPVNPRHRRSGFVIGTPFTACLILLALCAGSAYGQDMADAVRVSQSDVSAVFFDVWEDPAGAADLPDAVALPEHEWQRVDGGSDTFGITSSVYWLRTVVQNEASQPVSLIAELAYSQLDHVVFHVIDNGKLQVTHETGDTLPFYPRQIDHPNMLLAFDLAPGQVRTLYIRVETAGSMILPLKIWHEPAFFSAVANEQKFHFFYYGALSVIILINLAVFLTLREKLYLYYALAVSGYLLFFASIKGYSFQLLYPDWPGLHARALLVSMPILALFSVLFCRALLRTAVTSPRLDVAMRVMVAFEIVNLIAALTLSYNAAVTLSSVSALVFFSLLFIAGPVTWAAGVRAGAFFTIAWTPLTIGVLATAGRALGFFPENFLTENAMQIGSGLEAFILTLALADRLYREREEKIRAQAESLRQEQARNEAQSRLTQAMTWDLVTGLPNRNLFEHMVDEQLQRDPTGQYMVGVARLTRLNEINRTLGMDRTDRLVRQIADDMRVLAAQLPYLQWQEEDGSQERVYQLSRDSFGLLVNTQLVTDGYGELNAVLQQLMEPVALDQLAIELHPKFGAAAYPEHGRQAAELIRNAHVAMEIAPHDRFETGIYAREYDIYSEARLTLMTDLRNALLNDRTDLHYQPKFCLHEQTIVGVEALIRWHHPERGWVAPADFVPLAEETGVITQLTRWAINRAIRDLATLRQGQPALAMAINISARDLLSSALPDILFTALDTHGIEPAGITLELTETAAMEDPERCLAALQGLAGMGFKLSIDDFGSGYSSLSYMKQLPASELKLDRSLIDDVDTSDNTRVIVRTALNMAHSLGYEVVAEGVESERAARLLACLGCDRLQGFWLCQPCELGQLQTWLSGFKPPSLE
jgi:EAL domain-containing protein (putative c-di-GMP-specific phosphodiesterase class I)/GGDEF domain-containing protein